MYLPEYEPKPTLRSKLFPQNDVTRPVKPIAGRDGLKRMKGKAASGLKDTDGRGRR